MNWISVEDKLPIYDQSVLVFFQNRKALFPEFEPGGPIIIAVMRKGFRSLPDEWISHEPIEYTSIIANVGEKIVTHWMPLPKRPKDF